MKCTQYGSYGQAAFKCARVRPGARAEALTFSVLPLPATCNARRGCLERPPYMPTLWTFPCHANLYMLCSRFYVAVKLPQSLCSLANMLTPRGYLLKPLSARLWLKTTPLPWVRTSNSVVSQLKLCSTDSSKMISYSPELLNFNRLLFSNSTGSSPFFGSTLLGGLQCSTLLH